MNIKFLSQTKFEATDGTHTVISDQPKIYGGTGEGMEPVSLLLASLGSCIAIFISQILVRRNVDLSKCSIKIDKEMADNPRRVAKLDVALNLPEGLSESDKKVILKSANMCTIHGTLHGHPEIDIKI